jgi:hypothetical protein
MIALLTLAWGACDSGNTFDSENSGSIAVTDDQSQTGDDPMVLDETTAVPTGASTVASASFGGGIPIGMSAQPITAFGSRYNGSIQNNGVDGLMSALSAIKARGGKIAVMMAGNQRYYRDAAGHFDFGKWKARIDRFRHLNLDPYIKDGTIIGHFMIDEPNDPSNWNGRPVPASTVDQMAQYSKSIWPGMVTIARTEPKYFPSNMRYLDAAWAQYLTRRGNVNDYIKRNVADAQQRHLALVVGLNIIHGGSPNGTKMSASEVSTFGSAMLSSTYPCAFISWQWNTTALNSAGMPNAMDVLRKKAQNRALRSCRGS